MVRAQEGVAPSALPGGKDKPLETASSLHDPGEGFIARILRSLGTVFSESADAETSEPGRNRAGAELR